MKNNARFRGISDFAKRALLTLMLPAVLYAALCVISPQNFLKGSTLMMLIVQSLPNLAIGWAMVFGMSVGLFDFSAGARLVFGGLIGVYFSQSFGMAGFIIGCMVGSLVLAVLTGVVYSYLRIPSIITGFAAMLVFESMSVMMAKKMVNAIDTKYLILGKNPYILIVMLIMFIAVYISFNHTKFGYQIKAIGGNEHVARGMGINANRLKLMTYIIGGIFLGVATILLVSSAGTVQPQDNMASMSKCFTPMMGVMIGMFLTSSNPIIGTFIGELCITMVSSGLIALKLESRLQNVFVGIFLILFMAMQINKGEVGRRLRRKFKTA
ncbi:MAG: ABC transporter permease [Oscillospiraceae bacterium]|jgi:ribose transport system permease protein